MGGMMGKMGGMMGGAGGGGGGSSGGDSGDKTKASMFGFQVPSMSGIGLEGRDKGNAEMLQAAGGGRNVIPTANTGGSSAVDSLMKSLMDSSSNPNPKDNSIQRENPYGKNLDNPEGIDMLHPTGQRQDLNLGNYGGKQKGVSDMGINWDKLKL